MPSERKDRVMMSVLSTHAVPRQWSMFAPRPFFNRSLLCNAEMGVSLQCLFVDSLLYAKSPHYHSQLSRGFRSPAAWHRNERRVTM